MLGLSSSQFDPKAVIYAVNVLLNANAVLVKASFLAALTYAIFHSSNSKVRKPHPVSNSSAPRGSDRVRRRGLRFPKFSGLIRAYQVVHRDIKRVVHHIIELRKWPRIHRGTGYLYKAGNANKNKTFPLGPFGLAIGAVTPRAGRADTMPTRSVPF